MATRVYLSSTNIKVSKIGFDALTTAETNLLLSLNNRSGQFLQRGYLSAGSLSGGKYTVVINFPITLSSTPEVLVQVVYNNANQGADYKLAHFKVKVDFTTTKATVTITPDPTWVATGIVYAIMRKRITT